MKKIIVSAFVIISSLVPLTAMAITAHPAGTNIVNQGTVYFMDSGMSGTNPVPYNSAGAFLSYKFNSWQILQLANSADLDLLSTITGDFGQINPRPGSLINDHGTVYEILAGTKVGFTSESVFKGYGFSFANVYPGDVSFMNSDVPLNSFNQKHSLGTLVNDKGTLYIMLKNSKIGIPSMAILDSWGYWASDAVLSNSYDSAAPSIVVLRNRQPEELDMFSSSVVPDDEWR